MSWTAAVPVTSIARDVLRREPVAFALGLAVMAVMGATLGAWAHLAAASSVPLAVALGALGLWMVVPTRLPMVVDVTARDGSPVRCSTTAGWFTGEKLLTAAHAVLRTDAMSVHEQQIAPALWRYVMHPTERSELGTAASLARFSEPAVFRSSGAPLGSTRLARTTSRPGGSLSHTDDPRSSREGRRTVTYPGTMQPDRSAPSPRAPLARVSAEPLSLDEHLCAVAGPDAGAVASFVGQVRDHDPEADGRVVSLEYSAHPEAERILTEIAARFTVDGVRVAVSHRVGLLAVGDYALVACVSSAHRAAAFDTCRALVEAVKVELPVWKRQITGDGAHTWVGL